jgi:hypothetical protein
MQTQQLHKEQAENNRPETFRNESKPTLREREDDNHKNKSVTLCNIALFTPK